MIVCKRWHSFVQNDLEQLVIYAQRPPYMLSWGPLPSEPINDRFIVREKRLNEITFKFPNLKRLFLFGVNHFHRFLNPLNKGTFDQLVELKITYLCWGTKEYKDEESVNKFIYFAGQ